MYYRDLPFLIIFKASKRRLIQVNYLLKLKYEFKYALAVNIIIYRHGLIYAHLTQGLSPFLFLRRVLITPSLKTHVEDVLLHIDSEDIYVDYTSCIQITEKFPKSLRHMKTILNLISIPQTRTMFN